jgi:hypothetical protein
VASQNEALERLSQRFIELSTNLTGEINKLKNYNNLLPSEKESRL